MFPLLFTIPKVRLGTYDVGPVPIHSYGVMLIVALLACSGLVWIRAKRYGIKPNKGVDMCFWAMAGGVIGARIGFIAQDLPYYFKHPDQLVSLRFSGLTAMTGEILAIAFIYVWTRRHRYRLIPTLDLAAPGYLLGYSFGRMGCLLNGCCFGGICSPKLPWAATFRGVPGYHHPAQAYDALLNLCAMGFLLWLETKRPAPGSIAAGMLVLHGAARFICEFWREGTPEEVRNGLASSTFWGPLPFTQAHAAALITAVGGGAWFYLASRRQVASGDGTTA